MSKSKRNLSDWLDSYLQLTSETEPPESFRLWTGISVIASALQRKCRISWGMLNFFPNMYIVLVGPPASRKGTALAQGYYFLSELGIAIAADSCTRQALIKRLKAARKTKVNQATGEQIVHSSLTIYNEELTVLLGYKDVDFLTVLTNWYDCGRGVNGIWERETLAHDLERVSGIWVNILGASTQSLLRSSLPTEAIGSGFSSRVIFVNETKKGKQVAVPTFTEKERKLQKQLKEDLQQILDLSGEFSFTEAWKERWVDWYEKQEQDAYKVLDQNKFEGYVGRRSAHLMKLMMILNASRTSSMQIDVCDFDRALGIMQDVEKRMSETFNNFGRFEYADVMSSIIKMLKERGEVLTSEVYQSFSHEAEKKILDGILETIVSMKYAERVLIGTDFLIKWKKCQPSKK